MIKEKKAPENGRVETLLQEQSELMGKIVQRLNDQQEQIEEISKGDPRAQKELFVAGQLYNTDRKHLSEMTNLPTMAIVEPFSLATTLGMIFDEDVVGGKLSLADCYMDENKKLFRGFKGGLQGLAAQHARETEAAKTEATGGEIADLGRGF